MTATAAAQRHTGQVVLSSSNKRRNRFAGGAGPATGAFVVGAYVVISRVGPTVGEVVGDVVGEVVFEVVGDAVVGGGVGANSVC